MALQKTIIAHNGVETNYHRVSMATLHHNHTLDCILESFVSKDYANNDSFNNEVNSYHFSFDNISIEEEESLGIRQLAYQKIKESSFWSDSEDC